MTIRLSLMDDALIWLATVILYAIYYGMHVVMSAFGMLLHINDDSQSY